MSKNTLEVVTTEPPGTTQLVPWGTFEEQVQKLKATAETLQVTDVSQTKEMKLARATRLTLKDLRVAIEARRVELKEFHLREGQRIDRGAKALKEMIKPLEARLLDQEQYAERLEAERKRLLKAKRETELSPYLTNVAAFELGDMAEEDFSSLLIGAKTSHEAKQAAIKRLEEERIAAEKAVEAEQERVRQENIRLKKEAQELEAKAKMEREAAEAERQRLLKEAEIERNKAQEAARAAALIAKAEQDAIALKARQEREAREALEAKAAQEKAAAEKAERDRLAAIEAAAKAPDRHKLTSYSMALGTVPRPEMSTSEGNIAMKAIYAELSKLCSFIDSQSKTL